MIMLFKNFILALFISLAANCPLLFSQTPISRYEFDGDLLNASTFLDKNGIPAPDGTFKDGAISSTPIFGLGVDGTPNGALRLDGVNDWLDITTAGHPGESVQSGSSSGPGLVSGTVMAWVKLASAASGETRWLMGSSNSNQGDFQSWRFGWNGSELEAVAHAADIQNEFIISDTSDNTDWADGDWHHIAVKWDGFPSVDEGKLYVDGVPVGSPSSGSSLTASATQTPWEFPMAIGARNNGGVLEGFWDGLVDDFRVYAEAVSDAFILSEFNSVNIIPTPDFDSDNDVDGADFLTWQRGFGIGTTFAEGDANGDMTVDDTDLAIWQGFYGQSAVASTAVQAVPEPATLYLLVLGVAGAITGRRCIRRGDETQ